jgi:hypothetical protein
MTKILLNLFTLAPEVIGLVGETVKAVKEGDERKAVEAARRAALRQAARIHLEK